VRAAFVLPLVVLAASCGSSTAAPPDTRPVSAKNGPPAAWIETRAGNHWLGFSSWCWRSGQTGTCADAIAPRCGMQGVPDIEIDSGELVHVHLGYTPDEASIEGGADTKLQGREVSWHVEQSGPFLLFTRGRDHDASYVGCVRLR
jgi:hypothetical protein